MCGKPNAINLYVWRAFTHHFTWNWKYRCLCHITPGYIKLCMYVCIYIIHPHWTLINHPHQPVIIADIAKIWKHQWPPNISGPRGQYCPSAPFILLRDSICRSVAKGLAWKMLGHPSICQWWAWQCGKNMFPFMWYRDITTSTSSLSFLNILKWSKMADVFQG